MSERSSICMIFTINAIFTPLFIIFAEDFFIRNEKKTREFQLRHDSKCRV